MNNDTRSNPTITFQVQSLTSYPTEPGKVSLSFDSIESLQSSIREAGYACQIKLSGRRGNPKAQKNLTQYLSPDNWIPSTNPKYAPGLTYGEILENIIRFRLSEASLSDSELTDRNLLKRIASKQFLCSDLCAVAAVVCRDLGLGNEPPTIFSNPQPLGRMISLWLDGEPPIDINIIGGSPKHYEATNL